MAILCYTESVQVWHGGVMTIRYKNSFRNKLLDYIEKMQGTVVLRKDVESLGDARQVSRALTALIEDRLLVRISLGIYAKARTSKYIDDAVIRGGFTDACIETLKRLGVTWEPSQAVKDYNEGRSQQVPARFEIRLKSRLRRQLAYGEQKLKMENMIYAK